MVAGVVSAMGALLIFVFFAPPQTASEMASAETPKPKPRRIVSLALGADEILGALVEPDRIRALSRHAGDPSASNVVDVARAVGVTVDRDPEQIVALEPDLVVAARYTKLDLQELIRVAGAKLTVLEAFGSFEDIAANITLVGRAVDEPARARELIDEMWRKLEDVRDRGVLERRRVLYLAPGRWTTGTGTTIHELITRAGHVNAAAALGLEGHQRITSEQILASRAEVVLLETGYGRGQPFAARLAADPQLSPLSALKEGRIVLLPSRQVVTVSHHLADAVVALAEAVERLYEAESGPKGEGS